MSYAGTAFNIDLSRGGFIFSPNLNALEPYMMVGNTRNLDLSKAIRTKRGGTSKDNSSVLTGSPRVMGLFDYSNAKSSENKFLLVATEDGKIYKNYTETIKTGLGATKQTSFETMNESVYICNGFNVPQVWDGLAATTSDLIKIPIDWSDNNQPKKMIKHGRKNSERLWAFGCPSNPYNIYVSVDNDGVSEANFLDAGSEIIHIDTGDGVGIIGAIVYADRIIFFGRTRAYIVDDTDVDSANWGYEEAIWTGGAGNERLIVRTPNDTICMTDDGDIYSVRTADAYGDYKAASLARPAFIDKWIRENINLGDINDFHAIYDPFVRAVKFFVKRTSASEIDTSLVYYIDRPAEEAWMIHDNLDFVSGLNASCSAIYEKTDGTRKLLTGGYNGFVWETEVSSNSDDDNAFYSGWNTPILDFDNLILDKKYRDGRVYFQPTGAFDLNITPVVDGNRLTAQTVSMQGMGAVLDAFVLGTDILGGTEINSGVFDIGTKGKRIQLEIYNDIANENFKLTEMPILFKPLSVGVE